LIAPFILNSGRLTKPSLCLFPKNYAPRVKIFGWIRDTFLRDRFVLSRLFTSSLSLFLALAYSSLLGVEKRSVLSFALVGSVFLASVLSAPLITRYRHIAIGNSDNSIHLNFALLGLAVACVVALLMAVASKIYSNVVTDVPTNLLLSIVIYAFFSSLSFILHEFLLVKQFSKAYVLMDISVIIMQVLLFAFFLILDQLSLITNVIISLTLSYIFHTTSVLSLIFYISGVAPTVAGIKEVMKLGPFLVSSNLVHVFDRVDKLFIAFFLPIGDLARYMTMVALYSPIRFFFDSRSKSVLVSKENVANSFGDKSQKPNRIFVIICFLAIFTLYPLIAHAAIGLTLGREWLLGIHLFYVYLIVEVLRGRFVELFHWRIKSKDIQDFRPSVSLTIILPLLLMLFASLFYGLTGLVLALIGTFLVLIRVLRSSDAK